MSVHRDHDVINVNGLADNCERCAEMAKAPLRELDAGNLRDLIQRTLSHRFGYGTSANPRSDAEATAMAQVMTALEHTGQLFSAAPAAVANYLRDRWRVAVHVHDEETP